MRKAYKIQAVEFLKTMEQALELMVKVMYSKNPEPVRASLGTILEDCQQGAIELGRMIELSKEADSAAISWLEEYCELVFILYGQLSEPLTPQGAMRAETVCQDMRRLCGQVADSVERMKTRLEAVFLPYKASMWDSLESVWKAAQADENCDAYVIPVPYYDRNPDGSFRRMHDEGNQYPDYVPVTRYTDYDFDSRRPDLIFIHNPYDEYNYVTSVHPFFYAKNLKQYTDRLVYIPYFMLNETSPDNRDAIGKISDFCTTPALVHADRIIVQSQQMRQIYINVLMEYHVTRGMGRKYWENKILGTGSPKMDKVLHTRKEELVIPGEWRSILYRPGGSKKKVIFYNTGLSALLLHNQQMIDKMEDVFRIFQARRADVALLWRPHPLIESTLASMRPQLWESYSRLVSGYRRQGWGIYDDTPDIDRAVILCDAYYGDWSSVVELCRKAGRPVMIQDAWLLRNVSI